MAPQHWVVVGGAESGGIVCREGKETSSSLSGRVAHGAVVEQIELVDVRLYFRLVKGDGPKQGWVSVAAAGKQLCEKLDASAASSSAYAFDLEDRGGSKLLAAWKGGQLVGLFEQIHQNLRGMVAGPPPEKFALPKRESGISVTWGYGPEKAQCADPGGKTKVIFHGDSITHGPPIINNTAAWAWDWTVRHPEVFVENHGWGGLMSCSMLKPKDFGMVGLQAPGELKGDYMVIMIGTNDLMAMCAADEWAGAAYHGPTGFPAGDGPPRLPADWQTTCRPCPEFFEKNLHEIVQEVKKANEGIKLALVTLPLLGEEISSDTFKPKPAAKLEKSPWDMAVQMREAVYRVAKEEACWVIPLHESMAHYVKDLEHRNAWTPNIFNMKMAQQPGMMERAMKAAGTDKMLPWEDVDINKSKAPKLAGDLCHLNETGGAILGALVNVWLEAQLKAAEKT
mmetsp:Transcript_130664/g.279385  ORF Transcript_130664/g.279385 Transcript_130664/m.279385 type:complete len:452 (+) Transcript_130664:71-1426(+)|eukprot:CAMPEP_0180490436 /NCGR_PEP_ID=MMETSP1036_2-20121128/39116_1 /TAXON_ID=632150 /ORGANISM="Azadinium spinosum, Strain 3D9" /LENGTH=451 /DNA_ID=CAMNT_0022498633 /DNA_START=32 /DNA_END=1387 /DNA_ORIENTATION=-